MNPKIIFLLIALITLTTTAFAIPFDINSSIPTYNQTLIGTKANTIVFTIQDSNTAPDFNLPQKLSIYWGVDANARTNLIVADTNLLDNTGVTCVWGTEVVKDRNFNTAKTCQYSWTMPDYTTMPPNQRYYIDYNLGISGLVASNPPHYSYFFTTSSIFQVTQPMSTSMAAMIALALFISACGLAVFAVMGLGNDMDMQTFIKLAISIIIILLVAWALYATVVAP